jgi:hypothetical protein
MSEDKGEEEKMPTMIETMNSILGSRFQIIADGQTDPVVLAKLPDEDLAPKNSVIDEPAPSSPPVKIETAKPAEKTNDDYLFQFYLGSLTVVGLFVLFRMIQKSK